MFEVLAASRRRSILDFRLPWGIRQPENASVTGQNDANEPLTFSWVEVGWLFNPPTTPILAFPRQREKEQIVRTYTACYQQIIKPAYFLGHRQIVFRLPIS